MYFPYGHVTNGELFCRCCGRSGWVEWRCFIQALVYALRKARCSYFADIKLPLDSEILNYFHHDHIPTNVSLQVCYSICARMMPALNHRCQECICILAWGAKLPLDSEILIIMTTLTKPKKIPTKVSLQVCYSTCARMMPTLNHRCARESPSTVGSTIHPHLLSST